MDETPITDYGFGTTKAIDTIEELIASGKPVDTVLINVMTLIRNRCNRPNLTTTIVLDEVREDMQVIAGRLDVALPPSNRIRPAIVFYITDYTSVIPRDFRRAVPPSKALYETTWGIARKRLKSHSNELLNCRSVQRQLVTQRHPWIAFRSLIRELKTAGDVVMLSHVECDYHLGLLYPHMILVDSFTGKQHTPKTFAQKVFGKDTLPFCPTTHALLGDPEFIKPTIMRKQKKELFELADAEHWKFKNCPAIKARLKLAGYIPEGPYPFK